VADDPASLLRQAAEVLRSTATAATPGPWSAEESTEYGFRVGTANQKAWVAWTGEYDDEPDQSRADARWIALAHPGLAGPLADWLEHAAKAHDATVQAAFDNWRGSNDTEARDRWIDRQTDQHALAVARTILGKETT
jgi:hypothetical protein